MSALRHPVLGCECSEGWARDPADGVVKPMPPVHDCAYIKRRNDAVSRAVVLANEVVPDRKKDAAEESWTVIFQREVNDMMVKVAA